MVGLGWGRDAKSRESSLPHAQISIRGKHREIIQKMSFCETGFFVYYTILDPEPPEPAKEEEKKEEPKKK